MLNPSSIGGGRLGLFESKNHSKKACHSMEKWVYLPEQDLTYQNNKGKKP